MKLFKKAGSSLNDSIVQQEVEPASPVDALNSFKSPVIEPAALQQTTIGIVQQQATHYFDIANNTITPVNPSINAFDTMQTMSDTKDLQQSRPFPYPEVDGVYKNITDIVNSTNDTNIPQINIELHSQIDNLLKNPPPLKPVDPNLIPFIDVGLDDARASIELAVSSVEQPQSVALQVSYPNSYSLMSNPISNIQTIEVINPKIIASMQAKPTVVNSVNTAAARQLRIYWEFNQTKNNTFVNFLIKVLQRDESANAIWGSIRNNAASATQELEKIDKVLAQFLEIEDTVKNIFSIESQLIPIGSSDFLNNLGVSDTSKQRLTAFIAANCLSNVSLKTVVESIGYEGHKSSTQGLFLLLQSLKNSFIYHSPKLTSTQNVRLADGLFIPPVNLNFCQFSLELPEDFTFNLKLNSNLSESDVGSTISTISLAYENYIQNFPSDQTQQIGILLELATKELRISSAINTDTNELSRRFNLNLTPGSQNINIIDSILGFIPLSINAVPTQLNRNSIAGFLQYKPSENTTVLPFEISPLRIDNQTFNPMTEFLYYNELKKLELENTYFTNILQFSLQFSDFYEKIRSSITKLRLLPYQDNTNLTNYYENFYSYDFYTKIKNKLTSIKSDPIAAIFAHAAVDLELRATLFYICSFNFLGLQTQNAQFAFTNKTHAFQILRRRLLQLRISSAAGASSIGVGGINAGGLGLQSTSQSQISTITLDQIIDAFSSNSANIISEILEILSTATVFYSTQNCFSSNRTSFVSVDEMTVMMTLFHAIVLYIRDNTTKFISSINTANRTITVGTRSIRTSVFRDLSVSKLGNATASSITEMYYILELFSKIRDNLFTLTGRINSGYFQENITFLKSRLPSTSLISTAVLSQSIRNSRFNIAETKRMLQLASTTTPTFDSLILDQYQLNSNQFNALSAFTSRMKDSSTILTIGIPSGTQRKLQIRAKQSNDPDIIKIKVYKIDQLNQATVYKPLEFLFEMSRYVPMSSSIFRNFNITVSDPINIVPTLDVSTTTQTYEYAFSNLSAERYNFLNDVQKKQLLSNHVTHWYLMQYMRYMTGMNMAENTFLSMPVNAPSMDPRILEAFYNSRPFSLVMSWNDSTNSFQSREESPIDNSSAYIREHYSVVNQLSRSTHIFSTVPHLVQKAIIPNIFDRVFNIMFDENSFEIISGTSNATRDGSKFVTYYTELESLGDG